MKPAQAPHEPTRPRAHEPRAHESHEIAKSEDMLAWPSHVVNHYMYVRVTKKINRIGGNFEGSRNRRSHRKIRVFPHELNSQLRLDFPSFDPGKVTNVEIILLKSAVFPDTLIRKWTRAPLNRTRAPCARTSNRQIGNDMTICSHGPRIHHTHGPLNFFVYSR